MDLFFVYMKRRVYQPGDQLRNQFFKRTEHPRRSDLRAAQSQISSRNGADHIDFLWSRSIEETAAEQPVRPGESPTLSWRRGDPSKGFPGPPPSPYLPCHGSTATCFVATADFIVCLPTSKEEQMPAFYCYIPLSFRLAKRRASSKRTQNCGEWQPVQKAWKG